jgi:hypothetical protein
LGDFEYESYRTDDVDIIANSGCSKTAIQKIAGDLPIKAFKDVVVNENSVGFQILRAKMVFICGELKTSYHSLYLETSNLVLNHASWTAEENSKTDENIMALNIKSEKISLSGANKITGHHLKFDDLRRSAPLLDISAVKLSGKGTLEIVSHGTDYNAEDLKEVSGSGSASTAKP